MQSGRTRGRGHSRMAFMQIKKRGDERAKKKAFDMVFDRFDHNKNGRPGYGYHPNF